MPCLFSSTSSLVEVNRIDKGLGQGLVGEVGRCCDGQAKAPGVSFFITSATDKVSFWRRKAAPSLLGEAAGRDENQSISVLCGVASRASAIWRQVSRLTRALSAAVCWTLGTLAVCNLLGSSSSFLVVEHRGWKPQLTFKAGRDIWS